MLSINNIIKLIEQFGGARKKMPRAIKPMLSTLVDAAFDREGWLFEVKWDGYRTIAEIENRKVKIYSRHLNLFNDLFFAITQSLGNLDFNAVFDGEIVALDEAGRADFQALQNYRNTGQGNLVYYIFDVLYYAGYDLENIPLIKRREILEKIPMDFPNIRKKAYSLNNGLDFLEAAKNLGLEGIMAKDGQSFYRQGIRGKEWLKIKILNQQEFIICGFTEPEKGRKIFGSLVLGVYENNELFYAGNVGTGFSEQTLKNVRHELDSLIRDHMPFPEPPKLGVPVVWVRPALICEVRFAEWTHDNRIRQPVFLGLRHDKESKEVIRERKMKSENEWFIKNGKEATANLGGRKLILTNLDKIYWPDEKFTKLDLINYYHDMAPYILPYLKDRPQSLHRYPNGIYGEKFYQKNMAGLIPNWIETVEIEAESQDEIITYMLCQDEAALIFLANLGCIELNVWNVRVSREIRQGLTEEKEKSGTRERGLQTSPSYAKEQEDVINKPDYFVFDLDPLEIEFDGVIATARVLHQILENLNIKNFCKTSGATGLHVYIPMAGKYTYEQAQKFGQIINILAYRQLPKITSMERLPEKRKGKVYLDIGQNARAQTLVSPYCPRPLPGAPVSAPLRWEEVKPGIRSRNFNMKNMKERLEKVGDLWKGVLGEGIRMEEILRKLSMKI